MAQFTERVPILKGKLSATASTATSYAWFVWKGFEEDERSFGTDLVWIPPCRSQLEKEGDYEESLGASYPKSTSNTGQRDLFPKN